MKVLPICSCKRFSNYWKTSAKLAGVLTLLFTATIANSASAVREDLREKLATVVCNNVAYDNPQTLWQAGIYDAQMDGGRMQPNARAVIPAAEVAAQYAEQARNSQNHHGKIWGTCPDQSAWYASAPAPGPAQFNKAQDVLSLDLQALAANCSSYQVDFAQAQSGPPQPVTVRDGKVAVGKLGNGTLSVTCKPKAPTWQGPVLWYLLPVGTGPFSDVPGGGELRGIGQFALEQWIQGRRRSANLPRLATHTLLEKAAHKSAERGELIHDRRPLQQLSEVMAANGYKFLGENRAQGTSADRIAWLLWNSPAHRGLLLSAAATHMGLGFNPRENFAVIYFAQQHAATHKP